MKKHTVIKALLIIFAIALVAVAVSFYISNRCIQTKRYKINAEVESGIRVVQLTDLHNNEFGQNNKRLIAKVEKAEPDVIFITGDLVNMYSPEYDVAVDLIAALRTVAPIYVSLGNHDVAFMKNYSIDLSSLIENAGATVLEKEYVDVNVSGVPVRIGGVYGYCLPPEENCGADGECKFLTEFSSTDMLKLLLCHMPAAFLEWGSLEAWNIDVIFSGHAHGGQVRLPIAGGLYAPDQGWFPGNVSGIYNGEKGNTLVLSTGLGGTIPVPRFNNVPQLVVVDIISEKAE